MSTRTPFTDLSRVAYMGLLGKNGNSEERTFVNMAAPIVRRFFKQTDSRLVLGEDIDRLCRLIWHKADEIGFPEPLGKGETRAATDMIDGLEDHVNQVIRLTKIPEDRVTVENLRLLIWQLLRTLCQPEISFCCRSYEGEDENGVCVRQRPDNAKKRVCGTQCEDCPLYVTLTHERHMKVLMAGWTNGSRLFLKDWEEVLLPQDFRELRKFLYMRARYSFEARQKRAVQGAS